MASNARKTRKGRADIENSGYYRCFALNQNDSLVKDIAAMLSEIQAMVICNGNNLDGDIIPNALFNSNNVKQKATSSSIDVTNTCGHFSKFKLLKTDCAKIEKKKAIELDYLILSDDKIEIFEIKDGDNFDTKKSEGEINSLKIVAEFFTEKTPDKTVTYHVVMWNATDIKKTSFKVKDLPEDCLLTGKQFCKIANCDFDKISQHRRDLAKEKREWALTQVLTIAEKINRIKEDNDTKEITENIEINKN